MSFSFSDYWDPSARRNPVVKSPTSPFCTSPSQLEEVTNCDITFNNTINLRSPTGTRSVKDFEEQLKTLRNENFNLKLRIYFLEEKMGTNYTLDKDKLVKKNVELQVEVTSLQKELQEKHELLCQAVKAMELEDEDHRKIVEIKEDAIGSLQQELEDLRMQLHGTNFESDGISHKSDVTGYYSSRLSNTQDSDTQLTELHGKIKQLESELNAEKENNASLQLILNQADALRMKCETLQKESQIKDNKIKSLVSELEVVKEQSDGQTVEIKELQEKLQHATTNYQSLQTKVQEDNRVIDDMLAQINEVRRKYASTKSELDKERKKAERAKMVTDMKIAELDDENGKQKMKIRDLQTKLEAAMIEVKKNQNLAVSKNMVQKSTATNTDDDSFSVSNPTTPNGTPKKDALYVQVKSGSKSAPNTPTSPVINVIDDLEVVLRGAGEHGLQILSDVKHLQSGYAHQKQKIDKLRAEVMKACQIIKGMMETINKGKEEIGQLKKHIGDLEREKESSVVSRPYGTTNKENMSPLCHRVSEMNITAANPIDTEKSLVEETNPDDMELVEQYKAFACELETKIQLLEATLNEKDSQMTILRTQYNEILITLEKKENRLVDLEFELLSTNREKCDLEVVESKDKEIERLNSELKKCNCYLQEIVNKELWEKNREIEKMHNKSINFTEISQLRKELSSKSYQLKVLKEKISELGIDVNIPIDEKCDFDSELNKLREDLINSEKLRSESNEICSVLSIRLEELAIFLDSLLKQKSVLGFLGQQQKKVREIIDNSLEFSRSFTMSLMLNPDQSLIQLSNLTTLLNGSVFQDLSEIDSSINPSNATLTYQSHLYKKSPECQTQDQIILALREEIFKLKCELQVRDNELNRLNEQGEEDQITTEGEVVLAVPEILNKSNTTTTTLKYASDNQSETESWSEPDRVVSKARMGLNLTFPQSKHINANFSNDSTEEESLDFKRTGRQNLVDQLQKRVTELENKLAETENALITAEARKLVKENQVLSLQKYVEELEIAKRELENNFEIKDKEIQNQINEIVIEKEEALKLVQTIEKQFNEARNEITKIQMEKNNLQIEYDKRVNSVETDYLNQLKAMEEKYEEKLEDLTKKSEKDVLNIQQELDDLKKVVKSYEEIVENLKQKESVAKLKLEEVEDKATTYLNDLDNITIQYSEAVLGKTKLENEKRLLEQKLGKIELEESEMKLQFGEIQTEFHAVKLKSQEQLNNLQQQKSKLEVRISELESLNAELHNKLVRLQVNRDFNSSLPNIGSKNIAMYKRQLSDNYSSEENNVDEFKMCSFGRLALPPTSQQPDRERLESNSSPDLGIESDHGRFSSLETQHRPLLQTIELTESMSDLLDGENTQMIDNIANCGNEHCCQKTRDYARENNDLKRKLLRMKRALEETGSQLTLANQRKKQVEKKICKQIYQTSQVLLKAKANLDSGSDNDLMRS